MELLKEFYKDKVSRIAYQYAIRELSFELKTSNNVKGSYMFYDTLYYSNSKCLNKKAIISIKQLENSEEDNLKKVSLTKELCGRIGQDTEDMSCFLEKENYCFYEISSDKGDMVSVVAKTFGYVAFSEKEAV